MAINFPDSPSAGDPHTEAGVTWTYDGEKWVSNNTAAPAPAPALWTRAGTTLSPATAGDDVDLGTGDLSAAAGTFSGDVLADTGTARGNVVQARTSLQVGALTGDGTLSISQTVTPTSTVFKIDGKGGTPVCEMTADGQAKWYIDGTSQQSHFVIKQRDPVTNQQIRAYIGRTTDDNSGTYLQIATQATGGGIGIAAPDSVLRNCMVFQNSNGTVGSIQMQNSATMYNVSSDYRLKTNVVPLANAAQRALALKPSRFEFIKSPGVEVDGFIAHELAEVVPEAVSGAKDAVDDEGKPVMQGVDQSKVVPLLTAALQEALTRIEALEAEVQALKGGI